MITQYSRRHGCRREAPMDGFTACLSNHIYGLAQEFHNRTPETQRTTAEQIFLHRDGPIKR